MNLESILFLRYWLGFCTIATVIILRGGYKKPFCGKAAPKVFLSAALIGTTYVLLYFESLRRIPTSLAVVIFLTYPAIMIIVERIAFKTAISPFKAVAAALIVAGSGLAVGKITAFNGSASLGLAFAVMAPIAYCAYLQITSRELAKMSAWTGALLIYAGTGIGFLGVILVAGFHAPPDFQSWLLLAAIVIFGSALPAVAFAYSMPRLGPSAYGIVASSELLTVIAIGVTLMGETLTSLQMIGASLVASGIVLSRLRPKSN